MTTPLRRNTPLHVTAILADPTRPTKRRCGSDTLRPRDLGGYAAQVPEVPVVYQSSDEDSRRWLNFPVRTGDIVISTRSKCGTTWMQMICGLLVFQAPSLPAPLSQLSPWLDWLVGPRDELYARLSAQEHRRFIKTHTPLDGIPLDPQVTYIVVARHPLDMAVSLYHQGDNLDRDRIRQLTAQPPAEGPAPDQRPRADQLVPDPSGVLKKPSAFFRQGTSGSGRELLADAEMDHYRARTAQLAAPDLLEWLHRDHVDADREK